MAPIDLNKNKDAIVKAHKEVSDPKNETNWALFGYEGPTDVLKLVSKGDGGIEELTEDLSGGKILYAYLKVIDPNTNLPKFVFINWQGEGVPEVRKGSCANHVRDVQNLLRGAHVSINARTEDDVDEELIIAKVAKASGANYSYHKEAKRPMPVAEPVGSVYQKVKPQIEIKPDIREKFWEKNEQEERQRITADKQRKQQERAKLDEETRSREEKDTKMREQKEMDRLKKIRDIREAEKKASSKDTTANNTHWDAEDARRDEEERAHRSDQLRKDRAAEVRELAGGRAAGARGVFEQKPKSQFDEPSRPPVRQLKEPEFLKGSSQPVEPAQRKQPIQLPKEREPAPVSPPSPPAAPVSPPVAPASPPAAPASPPAAPAVEEEEVEEDLYDDATVPARQPPAASLLSQGLPRRPPSDDEEEDYQNWEEEEPVSQPASSAAAPVAEEEFYDDSGFTPAETAAAYDTAAAYVDDNKEELYQDAGDTRTYRQAADMGVCARALYDYQADEDNEISFDPDDIIIDIDKIDEGWWIGTAPDGNRGMFPANYVEEI